MPKIFEYLGIVFFFYANDHKPLHVHARYAEYESIIELEISEGKLKKIKFKHSAGHIIRFHQPSGKILKSLLMFITLK